jgi:ATP-binding protein involved in chromosome partitioning
VAILDSSKAVEFVKKLELPVLGIVENMSGFVCPHCGEEIDIFGKGGGEKEAGELGVPFLGAIPLDPEMRKAADEGRPFIIRHAGANRPDLEEFRRHHGSACEADRGVIWITQDSCRAGRTPSRYL